jgi:hypothetical protein
MLLKEKCTESRKRDRIITSTYSVVYDTEKQLLENVAPSPLFIFPPLSRHPTQTFGMEENI